MIHNNHKIHTKAKHVEQGKYAEASSKFSERKVSLADTPLFFPEGFEKIFLTLYFILLPYIAGTLFLFFYISNGELESFLSLNKKSSIILTWAIGYEIIAVLILLYIMKLALFLSLNNNRNRNKFRIP